MRRSVTHAATLAIAAASVLAIHGCSEKLEGGAGCPIVCPNQNVELRDTVLAAVTLDTTLAAYPALGEEPNLLLTWRPDTLETRIVIRYDTLPTTYTPTGSTTSAPIDRLDSARLSIRLRLPVPRPDQTVTVEAYDVDTTVVDDTVTTTMLPLFRPDRFLGSRTFKPSDFATTTDTLVTIPIDSVYVLAKIQSSARLRVGLIVRASESAEIAFHSVNGGRSEILTLTIASSPLITRSTGPYSATPSERFVADGLSDFVIVAQRRPPDAPTEVLPIGGLPGRRGYLRFELPSKIVDSTSVVRATLLLTQYPNRLAARPAESISLYPQPVVASELVTDLHKAANLLGAVNALRLDSLRTAPQDSGDVSIEVVGVLQAWRATKPERAMRAMVLRLPTEGVAPNELYFFSTEAEEALRPRLRIVYGPRVGIGLP
jgi:hypothetical protein